MAEQKNKKGTAAPEPGEFVKEDEITLENGADEKEFDNGVSASFLRFDDDEETDGE
ncbi:MAG: hypothetical protein VB082_10740 [Christensenella sp.]|nr:hypothetical protein [Christensenella sp.]